MVKTLKTVPQKGEASFSQPAADKTPMQPRPEEYVPRTCLLTSDFKLDKGTPGQRHSFEAPTRQGRDLGSGPAKWNKRKRASSYENPKSKARSTHKSKKDIIPLTLESVQRLRDEDEEEENEEFELVAREKKTANAPQAAGSMVVYTAPPRTEDISEKGSGRVPESSEIEDVSYRSQQMRNISKGAVPESLRTEENSPSDSLGVATIEDSPTFPTFSEGEIREAQALGALELDMPHDGDDPFCVLFTSVEDAAGSSDALDLFHGVQHALNQVAAAYREACSRSRAELRQYEFDLQWVTEERNALNLLLGQRWEEIKELRAELTKAHQDQTDLSEQQKLELIGKLREKVDVIKAESLKWKENMDRFAAEKEVARAQLSLAESQLQSLKEKSLVERKTEELKARLATKLAKAENIKADADALVAVYRADAEAAQFHVREVADTARTRLHWINDFSKCQFRRETLEDIHARGFDLSEEITKARELKAEAGALASDDDDDGDDDDDDDDDGSKSGSQSGEDPDKGS
ncbi:uncharacterized protein [Nicotiana tomentosiformis]|uniref:uncharacterized protein n=1 Tax=Nicotiana tomentosiformis TaxID=4098 RepID=UPI00388CBAE6